MGVIFTEKKINFIVTVQTFFNIDICWRWLLWDIESCSLVEIDYCFWSAYCIYYCPDVIRGIK
jgi:hypothetical protein